MTVLVTGGTGLLGRVLLERATAAGEEVVALHRPATAPPPIAGVRWIAQDLAAPLGGDLPLRVDAVLHLAQSRRHREFPAGAVDTFAVNAMATVRLLDYARGAGAKRFVLASSGAVYRPGPAPLLEQDRPDPPNFYGHAKLAAEQAAAAFGADGELATIALRLFFVYGPGQDEGAFVPGIAERVREGRPIDLAGPEGMRCNPVHVVEAAEAVETAWRGRQTGVLNVAGPEVVSLRELGMRLGALLDREPRFTEGPPRGDLVADTTRMRTHLLVPRIGVTDGLAQTFSAPLRRPS
jgi:UDP-glucose 4-epimerase